MEFYQNQLIGSYQLFSSQPKNEEHFEILDLNNNEQTNIGETLCTDPFSDYALASNDLPHSLNIENASSFAFSNFSKHHQAHLMENFSSDEQKYDFLYDFNEFVPENKTKIANTNSQSQTVTSNDLLLSFSSSSDDDSSSLSSTELKTKLTQRVTLFKPKTLTSTKINQTEKNNNFYKAKNYTRRVQAIKNCKERIDEIRKNINEKDNQISQAEIDIELAKAIISDCDFPENYSEEQKFNPNWEKNYNSEKENIEFTFKYALSNDEEMKTLKKEIAIRQEKYKNAVNDLVQKQKNTGTYGSRKFRANRELERVENKLEKLKMIQNSLEVYTDKVIDLLHLISETNLAELQKRSSFNPKFVQEFIKKKYPYFKFFGKKINQ